MENEIRGETTVVNMYVSRIEQKYLMPKLPAPKCSDTNLCMCSVKVSSYKCKSMAICVVLATRDAYRLDCE